jgi:predicted type IV restriction endonuclease
MLMKAIITDIQSKLADGHYKNEEHIRLSLVTRILHEVGWDIWNPREVYPEFLAIPNEDKTRVDLALFIVPPLPAVFIEVKAVGQLSNRLEQVERQVRDYNRNNTAPFSIITDGRLWRFYFSQTAGEFAQKCFTCFDMMETHVDDTQLKLTTFLSKAAILNGSARQGAEQLLQFTQKLKIIQNLRDDAVKMTTLTPYPRLPEALLTLSHAKGIAITIEEIETILSGHNGLGHISPQTPATKPSPTADKLSRPASKPLQLDPEHPDSLAFTKIIRADFAGISVNSWNDLAVMAVKYAYQQHTPIAVLKSIANVSDTPKSGRGFSKIEGIDLWIQGQEARKCWLTALHIAKHMEVSACVEFMWRDHEKAAHKGKQAVLRWPQQIARTLHR